MTPLTVKVLEEPLGAVNLNAKSFVVELDVKLLKTIFDWLKSTLNFVAPSVKKTLSLAPGATVGVPPFTLPKAQFCKEL